MITHAKDKYNGIILIGDYVKLPNDLIGQVVGMRWGGRKGKILIVQTDEGIFEAPSRECEFWRSDNPYGKLKDFYEEVKGFFEERKKRQDIRHDVELIAGLYGLSMEQKKRLEKILRKLYNPDAGER